MAFCSFTLQIYHFLHNYPMKEIRLREEYTFQLEETACP